MLCERNKNMKKLLSIVLLSLSFVFGNLHADDGVDYHNIESLKSLWIDIEDMCYIEPDKSSSIACVIVALGVMNIEAMESQSDINPFLWHVVRTSIKSNLRLNTTVDLLSGIQMYYEINFKDLEENPDRETKTNLDYICRLGVNTLMTFYVGEDNSDPLHTLTDIMTKNEFTDFGPLCDSLNQYTEEDRERTIRYIQNNIF